MHDPRGDGPVAIAISGGGDSTALLLAAQDWSKRHGRAILAATVDHGLRPASVDEADHVARMCRSRGIPHETLRLNGLHDGPNLQARARAARYDALSDWAIRVRCDVVLLGHTADDAAETLILRLRRGAGIDGLARMSEWFGDRPAFARPFLDVPRAMLHEMLSARGVTPLQDPSNDDRRFDRVAVRQAIAELSLDIGNLTKSAERLREARQSLERRACDIAAAIAREDRGDLLLDWRALSDLIDREREQARRILLGALRWVGGDAYPPRGSELMTLLQSVRQGRDGTLAGCLFRHEGDRLRIARELAAAGPPCATDALWDGRWRVAGPGGPGLSVGALGHDIRHTPWRNSGLPRASVMASPSIRGKEGELIAAPLAGMPAGWSAEPCVPFTQVLIDR
nr:tRNA lysidine(34) synthetase TilS [Jannaschia sp. S6380]